MKPKEFKSAIKEAKEALRGKTLRISFVHGEKIDDFSFTSLRDFGNAILKFEGMGAGFGFIKVGNRLTQKGIYRPEEFEKVLSRGVWDEVFFLATTVKY